jgi:hypothetical protein
VLRESRIIIKLQCGAININFMSISYLFYKFSKYTKISIWIACHIMTFRKWYPILDIILTRTSWISNKCHNKGCQFHIVWTCGVWYQFIDIKPHIIRISEILYLMMQYKKYVKYVSYLKCLKKSCQLYVESMTWMSKR